MNISEPITAIAERMERLRRHLRDDGLDALLVTNPENRRYLSGFTGHDDGADSAGALLISQDDSALITDGRYVELAARECPGLRLIRRTGRFAPLAAETLLASGARQVGFEATHMTVAARDDLAAALAEKSGEAVPPALVATRELVEPLRAIKDDAELRAIERAVAITDATFAYLAGYLRAGLTEKQVAREIERFMLEQGADGMAFSPIVASGPNAALPHVEPSERELALGEPIIIDMGARFAGYCSDMTRTVCLGEPGAEGEAIYELVLRMQQAGESGIRPGMTGQQADALARDIAQATGHGEHYLHGLGHGLGLEIHESPALSAYAGDQVLRAGMVVTVEPGLYVGGWGGVRVEDTAVVTDDGTRVLTASHKRFALPAR